MEKDLQKELIRKTIHLLTGSIFAVLIYFSLLSIIYLSIFLFLSFLLMYYIWKTKKRIPVISDILDAVGREKEFPGLGALTLIFGSILSMLLFSKEIACASILTLAVGDAVSPIIGMRFGKTKTILSKTKLLEGFIAGTILSTMAVTPIVGFKLAFFASSVSLIAEFWDGTNFIDDNISIPLVAGTVMTLLNSYF